MEFDDDDGLDDAPGAPLLPLDDRLWRHPSEVARGGGGLGAVATAAVAREPRTLTVVALSSTISVLLTVGLIAAVGPLRVERVAETRVAPAADNENRAVRVADVSGLADRLRPSLVRLQVTTESGTSWASAVVVRSDGIMMTAAHVIAGATAVRASLADGTERAARVVGTDDDIDLAVLDLEGEGYESAVLGTATELRAGEPAITLGAPGSEGGATVTTGVVGGLGRNVEHLGHYYLDMIQIDRAIAPGSSGGAVVNAQGAVIAVAGMNVERERTVLGYAIPIDVAKLSTEQLLSTGRVTRVWLGIEGEDLGPRRSSELGVAGGVMVKLVKSDSPASRAGLAPGVVIVAIDGSPVPTMASLVLALRSRPSGTTAKIDALRGGVTVSISVTLTERPTARR